MLAETPLHSDANGIRQFFASRLDFIDQTAGRARDRIRLLLVKLSGATFENDLLLVRTAEREPAETNARQDDGDEKNPDAPFHETRRRLSCSTADG